MHTVYATFTVTLAFHGNTEAITIIHKSVSLVTKVRGKKYQNTVCLLLIDRETVTCA